MHHPRRSQRISGKGIAAINIQKATPAGVLLRDGVDVESKIEASIIKARNSKTWQQHQSGGKEQKKKKFKSFPFTWHGETRLCTSQRSSKKAIPKSWSLMDLKNIAADLVSATMTTTSQDVGQVHSQHLLVTKHQLCQYILYLSRQSVVVATNGMDVAKKPIPTRSKTSSPQIHRTVYPASSSPSSSVASSPRPRILPNLADASLKEKKEIRKLTLECVDSVQGERPTMEDTEVYKVDPLTGFAIAGVFDGHGGDRIAIELADPIHGLANYILNRLASQLLTMKLQESHKDEIKNKEKEDDNKNKEAGNNDDKEKEMEPESYDWMSEFLANVFVDYDFELWRKFKGAESVGGSCAIVLLFSPRRTKGWCCNVGDSRLVIVKQKKKSVFFQSKDQKPQQLNEKKRILACDGFIQDNRVNGELAIPRSFGDFRYKKFNNSKGKKMTRDLIVQQPVIAAPIVSELLFASLDEFLITLACDGAWDVVESKEMSSLLASFKNPATTKLRTKCKSLTELALHRGSTDNVTVMHLVLSASF
jgi:serine/threonine protein phosphatase PrpC